MPLEIFGYYFCKGVLPAHDMILYHGIKNPVFPLIFPSIKLELYFMGFI